MWRLIVASLSVLIPFSVSVSLAQTRAPMEVTTQIQVHVTYLNDRPVNGQVLVELMGAESVPITQTFTDRDGRALLFISSPGVFRVRASGMDIEPAVSDSFEIHPGDRMTVAWVRVQQKQGAGTRAPAGKTTVTTANELRIPLDAKKLFMQGMEALYRHDYPKAVESFEKAVAAYPPYDAAYDNLGATYMQLGQADKARAAFERAVQLNDKNADAERNYARLLMSGREDARAIEWLNKALTVEPQDPASLSLIAVAQLRTGNVDAALQNALKVHQVPHQGYAVAHYVAGRAYETMQQYQKATAEYKTYLQESPDGPEAQQVRAALFRVTASANSAPQAVATPQ